MSTDPKRCRSIAFTLNNYTEQEKLSLQNEQSFKYIVFQEEKGAGGTPHLQGYISLPNPTAFSTWRRFFGGRAHIEAAKGSADQNRIYCTKISDRIPGTVIYERGDIPHQGERKDLIAIVNAAKDTTLSMADIIEVDGANFLRYFKGIAVIRAVLAPARCDKTKVFWFYGSTGTGKTRRIHEVAPNAYWKQNSPWWCGYDPISHSDVVIDEYRGDFCKFSHLLQLFDRYPLSVQNKGGNCNFTASRIFISSPRSPAETWSSRTEEDIQQLLRRIEVIVEFLPGGFRRYVKGAAGDIVCHSADGTGVEISELHFAETANDIGVPGDASRIGGPRSIVDHFIPPYPLVNSDQNTMDIFEENWTIDDSLI